MAEFIEVMKQKERMTRNCDINCIECGLNFYNSGIKVSCTSLLNEYPDVYEKIVMDWVKEHPVITNADKFKEVFGCGVREKSCPIDNNCIGRSCHVCEFYEFWQQEYKEKDE